MSDDLVDVTLDKARIRSGETVTAHVQYTTDFGDTLRISASDGFAVAPPTHELVAGDTEDDVVLTVTADSPLAAMPPCELTFRFVGAKRLAEVNVDPAGDGGAS